MISKLIKAIKQKFQDMKTIGTLCETAEKIALDNGENTPGAEHFLLASITLEDGGAKRILQKFNVKAADLKDAVLNYHQHVLRDVGISSTGIGDSEYQQAASKNKLYHSQPTTQRLFKTMHKKSEAEPLGSVHVLEALLTFDVGIIPGVFKILGLNQTALQKEIELSKSRG